MIQSLICFRNAVHRPRTGCDPNGKVNLDEVDADSKKEVADSSG